MKSRWKEDILNDFKMVKVNNWIKIVQNQKEWKSVFQKAKTLVVIVEPVEKEENTCNTRISHSSFSS